MEKKKSPEKQKIIEAGLKLFGEKGYSGASMRDIARETNISVATLYYYFKDKEHLLFSIIEAVGSHLYQVLQDAKDEFDSPLESLRNMMFRHICLNKNENIKTGAKVFVEEEHNLSDEYWRIVHELHRRIYDIYTEQLRLLVKEGSIIGVPPTVAAFAILGITNWCYRWYREDGPIAIEDIAQWLTDVLLHGISRTETAADRQS